MSNTATIERKQDNSLVGQLEEVTMTYVRYNIGAILTQAQMGKVFVFVKAGKRVAVLSRPPGENLTIEVDQNGEVSYGL
jgi:hypothetical protein